MTIHLSQNRYGKSDVRVVKVTRNGQEHRLQELTVKVLLSGEFSDTYLTGDNSAVLPTDTIKNTIYVLAQEHPIHAIEEFAVDLSRHFQERLPHVSEVYVEIVEAIWHRMTVAGTLHPYAFTGSDTEKRVCAVTRQGTAVTIQSEIRDMVILKTTGSGFTNFLRDEYTTLQETSDRLLGTKVIAQWHYKQPMGDAAIGFVAVRNQLRQILLDIFATHTSDSLQNTLYEMGKAVLTQLPIVADIHLLMPNKHNLLVDFTPFQRDNPNQIFLPINEPFGSIEGTLYAD
ncbi:MAG: urate oxidase [Caldilineaceae bacterium]|nr:urate oxidase [Caldilineaceae bacterium]